MWTSRPSLWIYIGDANVLHLELRPAIRRATWNMLLGKIRIKISKKLKEENNNSNHQSFPVLFLTFEWPSFSHTICAEYQLWFIVVCVIDCVTHLLVYIIFICEMQLLFIDVGDAVAKVTCIIGPPVTRWLPKQTTAS